MWIRALGRLWLPMVWLVLVGLWMATDMQATPQGAESGWGYGQKPHHSPHAGHGPREIQPRWAKHPQATSIKA